MEKRKKKNKNTNPCDGEENDVHDTASPDSSDYVSPGGGIVGVDGLTRLATRDSCPGLVLSTAECFGESDVLSGRWAAAVFNPSCVGPPSRYRNLSHS
jgi:hypothetical protein